MFRIGEFSKIAQVSGRLLRYYDQIGLLRPVSIDPQTGYRFYSANQLPQLNQILILKELGLTLDQIGQMLSDHITPDDIRGMFLLRKAQIEQEIAAERRHLQAIESRLQRLDHPTRTADAEVVLKALPQQQIKGTREVFTSLESVRDRVLAIRAALSAQSKERTQGPFVVVIHSEVFDSEQLDCELGQSVRGTLSAPVTLPVTLTDGQVIALRELPAVTMVASSIHAGALESKYEAYQTVGSWIESNGYRVSGPGREVFHQLPDQPFQDKQHQLEGKRDSGTDTVIEIVFPVESLELSKR
jgi:DNA-binding transcriptional MerR regulator